MLYQGGALGEITALHLAAVLVRFASGLVVGVCVLWWR
jgi:hypothetical protein